MNFISKLKTKEQSGDHRHFESIKTGRYEISIQASKYHYCLPRETTSPEEYNSMEIAIFNKKGWLNYPNKSSILRRFNRFGELLDRADGINTGAVVYGYVPVDLIEDLINYLKKH